MHLKLIVATLALAFALPPVATSQTAVETTPSKPAAKRVVPLPRGGGENILARTVFQSLLGDLALQRGDVDLGVDAWADLAQRTRDPKVLARATEVAGLARQFDKALALSQLWLEVEPDSIKAQQSRSSLMLLANRMDDLAPQLARLLEKDQANLANNLLQLNRMLARHTDKKSVQSVVDRVASPYDSMPEAHYAMAQAAAHAGDNLRALSETEKALQLRPDWESAAVARAQVQAQQSNQTAIENLGDFVNRYPAAREARLLLARLLISGKQYPAARAHFDILLKDNPDNPDVMYPVAMLALQQGDTTTGRTQLERLLASEFPDKSTIHFFLGQLDQDQNKPDAALDHFRQVTTGDQYTPARARAAQILQQQGKHAEARKMLSESKSSSPAEKTQLLLAESLFLRETNQHNEAHLLLENALKSQPDNEDILYEAALTAERVGKHELLDAHLSHLLKLKPDHAHALNALGYAWAERKIRLPEAYAMISKALAQRPDDPFIMDSLGWVFFRQGKLEEALKTLENAYALRSDPEIAAHLGEVLWALGRQDDGRRILKEAQVRHPNNDVLNSAIKKFLR